MSHAPELPPVSSVRPAPEIAGQVGALALGTRLARGAPWWDDNGNPGNLAAAAMDALDWLEWMRGYMVLLAGKRPRKSNATPQNNLAMRVTLRHN